jgi:hypothetical protein
MGAAEQIPRISFEEFLRMEELNASKHEWLDGQHREFLAWVQRFRCPVLVSGYQSQMYKAELQDRCGWRCVSFGVQTRRGPATEFVWMNYPEPQALHDAAFVGDGFTDRQRIKRKAARWVRMLAAMPPAERAAVLSTIDAAGFARRRGPGPIDAAGSGISASCSGHTPMRRKIPGLPHTGSPRIFIVPLLGLSCPVISLRSVDLPAPFGPSRPVTPAPMVMVTSLIPITWPYHFDTFSARTTSEVT